MLDNGFYNFVLVGHVSHHMCHVIFWRSHKGWAKNNA